MIASTDSNRNKVTFMVALLAIENVKGLYFDKQKVLGNKRTR